VAKFQIPPIQGQQFLDASGEPVYPWEKWFSLVQTALSGPNVPASATAAGLPLQMAGLATDGNFLYVCVGVNSWKRVALSAF
jgi:hypothetical protein